MIPIEVWAKAITRTAFAESAKLAVVAWKVT